MGTVIYLFLFMFSKVDSVNKFSNRAVSIISKNVKVKKQKFVNLIRHQLTVLTGANNVIS